MTTTQTLSPVEVVTAIYEAFGRGDLEGLLSYVDENVEWCQADAGAPHPVLDNGRGIGHDAVRAYFGAAAERMAISKFVPHKIMGDGDTVLSLIEMEFADPAVGKTVNIPECHVFRVRDGKIVHYFPILDTATTAKAFGS
jgi:ketosteroid isomerase-like protein